MKNISIMCNNINSFACPIRHVSFFSWGSKGSKSRVPGTLCGAQNPGTPTSAPDYTYLNAMEGGRLRLRLCSPWPSPRLRSSDTPRHSFEGVSAVWAGVDSVDAPA